jgi:adenine-specific DNA-methyltransferase
MRGALVARSNQGPKPVDAITHDDKRTNIPTADAHDFVSPEIEEVRKVRYSRDESLDPQLVWRGKYPPADEVDDYADELVTDAPPIYIQEKIDPRVLIENLRRTASRPQDEPELTLFDSFDGLDEMESVDFYQHDANWSNRMILGDSLQVMASLAEREKLRGKVQMVYIDPPYGIKFGSNWQASVRNRDVKDGQVDRKSGRVKDVTVEAEQIKAFRDTWELGIHSYLSYLRDRLQMARDLLTDSGSCILQMGDENAHLVRSLMDEVFGAANYTGTIAFVKTSSQSTARIQSVFDVLLIYAKDRDQQKFRDLLRPKRPGERGAKNYTTVFSPDLSSWRRMTSKELADPALIPEGWRIGRLGPTTSQGFQNGPRSQPYLWDGEEVPIPSNAHWKYDPAPGGGMDRLRELGRLKRSGKGLATVLLAEDNPTTPLDNMWHDTGTGSFTEDQIYVVQTGAKVLQRCVLMCTDPGDLVLDPTCGSGTTAFVAEQWGRRWITIDSSRVALALARQRLMGAKYPWYLLADSAEGEAKEREVATQVLLRQEFDNDIRFGFAYERVPRITLGSIANNPDIKQGMSINEIDVAIKRHADVELLYDKPYEDKKKVRVAGPFTVESLSPHRSLAFGETGESRSEAEAAKEADAPSFEQSILDNLAKAGIQNGRRNERIEFESFETYAGEYFQAIGESETSGRVAIAIGPQYGTVSPAYVKKAAREAINAESVDLLCILGFAFDAQVTGVTEEDGVTVDALDEGFDVAGAHRLGRIPVLMVRMNADLLMGEELKKTGAGNLFTVFGEPDIDIEDTSDGLVVHLNGVDVYDPTTGDVRSNDTSRIALWMIDTDYNEESFFVRHCYFTGGNDPYKRLKTALKADIDPDAWASLYQTVSRPFAKPESGKTAVKVINDYGDEVMKVFEV